MTAYCPDASSSPTRAAISRRVVLLLGSLAALTLEHEADTTYARKRKPKKVKLCLNGQTTHVSKKKKKKLIQSGATSGACQRCSGNAECASGSICSQGVCRICTVTCNGDALACGETLNQRLSLGGTVYVCPGRYAGEFTTASVTVIGAGSGEDPATSTILDGRNLNRVVRTSDGATVSLSRLRITRGNSGNAPGGGLYARDGDLLVDECAIEDNHTSGSNFAGGGGVYAEGSRVAITNSSVTNNTSGFGGGIKLQECPQSSIVSSLFSLNRVFGCGAFICSGGGIASNGTPLSFSDTEISGNSSSGDGGGISTVSALTLDGTTRIVNNVASTAWRGGGIKHGSGAVVTGGATIKDNTPDDINPPL